MKHKIFKKVKLHFKCVFMDYKWYLLLINDNFSKTSAKSFFLKCYIFYIHFNTVPTYLNMVVSWDSWHFLLKSVLLSYTCISVCVHLPFHRQKSEHLCAKNQKICPWESEISPKYWKVSQLTPLSPMGFLLVGCFPQLSQLKLPVL